MKYRTILIPLGGDSGGIQPTGTLNVTSNGTYDVTNYKYVNSDVHPDYLDYTIVGYTTSGIYINFEFTVDSGSSPTWAYLRWKSNGASGGVGDRVVSNGTTRFRFTENPGTTREYEFGVYNYWTKKTQRIQITLPPIPPQITNTSITNITDTTADASFNMFFDGGATPIRCGVCYSTSINPTVNDTFVAGDPTIINSNQTLQVIGLTPSTNYYARFYAENSAGIYYSQDISFTTEDAPVTIDYFYVENTYNGQNTVKVYASSAARTTDAQYSKDEENWTNMVFNSFPKTINITLNQGEKVYFRSSTGWSGDVNGIRIQPQQSAIAGGDLRTILNYTDVDSVTSIGRYDINCLFKAGGSALSPVSGLTDISAVKLNTITSTTSINAFEDFCWKCPNLVKGIDLSPITSIYDNPSFDPDATFQNMYLECRQLNEAWAPNIQSWDNDQFEHWLERVSASGTLHAPTGLTIPTGVYGIPSGWTRVDY